MFYKPNFTRIDPNPENKIEKSYKQINVNLTCFSLTAQVQQKEIIKGTLLNSVNMILQDFLQ